MGQNILYRGIENGKHVVKKVPFSPKLYVKSNTSSDWKDIFDRPLKEVVFQSQYEMREFVKKYEGVEGFEVNGFIDAKYQYIHDKFKSTIAYDKDVLRIQSLDIEVAKPAEGGFPKPENATGEILLITLYDSKTCYTWASKPYTPTMKIDSEIKFIKCTNERELLLSFLHYWQNNPPDIVTGWNVDGFDIPYLINRINRLFNDNTVEKLSPFGKITSKTINNAYNTEVEVFDIVGVAILDYLVLYKKFALDTQESYQLDNIAKVELNESKVEYEGTFEDFYTKDWDRFVTYNQVDAILVTKLDNKLKFLDLVLAIAYIAKINYQDVMSPVRTWDVLIYNFLHSQNIAIPPRGNKPDRSIIGAYVKSPVPGKYGWTVSFDFASLYPSIIRQWNMSPDTFVRMDNVIIEQFIDPTESDLVMFDSYKDENLAIAANGSVYRRDKVGFIPKVIEVMLNYRKTAKSEMLKLDQEYQKSKSPELSEKIAALNAKQNAAKVLSNSLYGALGNFGFRYFDANIAEGITLTGQVSIIHTNTKTNDYLNKILKTNKDYCITIDTDSGYFNMDPLVNAFMPNKSIDTTVKVLSQFCEDKIQPVIQSAIDQMYDRCNCSNKVMAMKREAIASKSVFLQKKRYAMMVHNSEGVDYSPYKLKIMGMDIIKSSTPIKVREMLKDILVTVFIKDNDELINHISQKRDEFMKLDIDDIAFPRGVTEIDKYVIAHSPGYAKKTPINVRASILYNKYANMTDNILIENGDKIRYIYLKEPNTLHENVIGWPSSHSYPKHIPFLANLIENYADKETMWNKTFMQPVKGITDAIGWKTEHIATLEDLFG